MRTRFMSALLVAALALTLGACGANSTDSPTPASDRPTQSTAPAPAATNGTGDSDLPYEVCTVCFQYLMAVALPPAALRLGLGVATNAEDARGLVDAALATHEDMADLNPPRDLAQAGDTLLRFLQGWATTAESQGLEALLAQLDAEWADYMAAFDAYTAIGDVLCPEAR